MQVKQMFDGHKGGKMEGIQNIQSIIREYRGYDYSWEKIRSILLQKGAIPYEADYWIQKEKDVVAK
jgi:hypothetical protein